MKKKVEIVRTKMRPKVALKILMILPRLQLLETTNSTYKQPKQPQRRKEHKTVTSIATKSVYFSELFDQI
jgi:hypothetical protein